MASIIDPFRGDVKTGIDWHLQNDNSETTNISKTVSVRFIQFIPTTVRLFGCRCASIPNKEISISFKTSCKEIPINSINFIQKRHLSFIFIFINKYKSLF